MNERYRNGRPWVPSVAGHVCRLIGVLDLVSAVFAGFRHSRVHGWLGELPGGVTTLAAVGQLTSGPLLILLAHALRRRKRRAWCAVVVLLPVSAALHLLHRHQLVTAVIALVLLGAIVVHRREFHAKADPRTRLRALVGLLGLGGVSVLLGLLIVRPGRAPSMPSWPRPVSTPGCPPSWAAVTI
ncbi:hypothetical protein ABZ642_19285 [Streptomyces sp. NPDC007157]|uniref:hypothetical protein n=1 Tax=Streptomyces sp. NPDC007157 TaxID=3154681 RepID=UPI0033F11F95